MTAGLNFKPCPKCNAACTPGATFCSKCGHNFAGGAPAAMPLAPAAYYPPPMPAYYAPPMAMAAPWRCPRCAYAGQAMVTTKVSTGGWILFVVLLFVTIIFCWVGLLIKETKMMCPQCKFSY